MAVTDYDIDVPDDASDEEAAAIAAAVSAHISRLEAEAVASEDGEATWDGDRWAFAGRIAGLDGHVRRVPTGAPRDAWTAAGRRDRF
jgi:hypothetical protein